MQFQGGKRNGQSLRAASDGSPKPHAAFFLQIGKPEKNFSLTQAAMSAYTPGAS